MCTQHTVLLSPGWGGAGSKALTVLNWVLSCRQTSIRDWGETGSSSNAFSLRPKPGHVNNMTKRKQTSNSGSGEKQPRSFWVPKISLKEKKGASLFN